MTALEVDCLEQKAVLYAFSIPGDYGRQQVTAAAEINVRWERVTREEVNGQGETIAINSTVYVDQEITEGSLLWLGALADLPSPVIDLMQVVSYSEIPDIKGRKFRRAVSVIKYSDTLPTIVS